MAKKKAPLSPHEAAEAQRKKIREAEGKGRSVSTMNRLWRELFIFEDTLKRNSKGGYN